ncbi:hypothetical protein J121_1589 [Qipengyuania citrea LAMA 915]|uniref:Uncharacterized protein n=1 Tax=Qipengyuania citrea LAMA 915 TaxID=1306953 RepID=A0A0L1KAU3_9SPHN|nr:hypothetical protein J121_1589 [Qipengyuania citrea LAMA 915]
MAGKALCRTNRRHSSRLHWVSASFRSPCRRRKTSMRRSAWFRFPGVRTEGT